MRRDEPVREQVQAQVGVVRLGRRRAEVVEHHGDRGRAHATARVGADGRGQLRAAQGLGLGGVELARAGPAGGVSEPEAGLGEERVEHPVARLGQRGQPDAPGALVGRRRRSWDAPG